jgi:alpha-galactosidase
MLTLRQATVRIDGHAHPITPERSNSFDAFFVDFQRVVESDGVGYTLYIHPKQDLRLDAVELEFQVEGNDAPTHFWANGYQSWSETRLLPVEARLPRLRRVARAAMGRYGDEHIGDIARGAGYLYAWSICFLKKNIDSTRITLAASRNESSGFTLWQYDARQRVLRVRKDLCDGGLRIGHSFPALDIWLSEGDERAVTERYLADFQTFKKNEPALGWTSWYRHFTKISQNQLLHDLAGVADSGLPFRYFQVDDGWQTHVGDWLSVKPEFPDGMGHWARQVRARGMVPGLWLAPFVVSRHADLFRKNPDWLLRDAHGKPLRVGWNPMWGGWYYALDVYHAGVRDYLSGVFHVATEKWGYEMFKLDFLFAACLAPPPGKTRGQVMHEAMCLLRDWVGPRQILACGAPLGSALGQVDFMRIGGDIHLEWEHRLLGLLRHRERVDTLASLRSTLGRWLLDGRAWGNDPDVFILRSEGQSLTPTQQHTVLTINALLGTLLFTSDDVGAYAPEQMAELEEALNLRPCRVERVREVLPDVYQIDFQKDTEARSAFCNLTGRRVQVPRGAARLDLEPYESMVF